MLKKDLCLCGQHEEDDGQKERPLLLQHDTVVQLSRGASYSPWLSLHSDPDLAV